MFIYDNRVIKLLKLKKLTSSNQGKLELLILIGNFKAHILNIELLNHVYIQLDIDA